MNSQESSKTYSNSELLTLVLMFALGVIIIGLVVQVSWNYSVPHIWKGMPHLEFVHALALAVLIRVMLMPAGSHCTNVLVSSAKNAAA